MADKTEIKWWSGPWWRRKLIQTFWSAIFAAAVWVVVVITIHNLQDEGKKQPESSANQSLVVTSTEEKSRDRDWGLFVKQSSDAERPATGVFVWKGGKESSQTTTRKLKVGDVVSAHPVGQQATQWDTTSIKNWNYAISGRESLVMVIDRTEDYPGKVYLFDGPTTTLYKQDRVGQKDKSPRRIVQNLGSVSRVEFYSGSTETVTVDIVE